MRHKILATLVTLLVLIPVLGIAEAVGADEYDSGKGCYRELLRQRGAADEGKWRKCIAFFDIYYEKNKGGPKATAALFSTARLKQEHFALRGNRADLESSIKDFNELIATNPGSPLADDALYRIGCMRQDEMGETERARKAFKHIVDNYSNGDMAVHARARLAKLGDASEEKTDEAAAVAATAPAAETAAAEAAPEEVAVATVPSDAEDPKVEVEEAAADPIEEKAIVAEAPQGDEDHKGATADAFDRATLLDLAVNDSSNATNVNVLLDKGVEHSVQFTGVGPRTGSPPELDVILLHTKPSRNVVRERAIDSRYVESYKVRRLILSSGIKISFKLKPNTHYRVSKTAGGLAVSFGSPNVATAVMEPTGIEEPKASPSARLAGFRVVIDPGHGGDEEGAVGPGGVMEKDVTLAMAKRLAAQLRKETNATVYLTRTTDTTMTLDDRTAFAVAKKADLFISIHANASKDRGASGIETYYLNNASDEAAARLARLENKSAGKKLSEVEHILSTMLQNYDAAESQQLAKQVQVKLARKVNRKHGEIRDRGVRSALFYVLVGAKCPAILVETAFISNPKEEKLLKDRKYQRSVADAISDGVKGYLKQRDKALVSL